MSYQHNNLWAMRQRYWQDEQNLQVQQEKQFLQQLLHQHAIFEQPSLDDVQFFFFSLPSHVIVQGYALGFQHDAVVSRIQQHLQCHKQALQQRKPIKTSWRKMHEPKI